MMRQKQYLNLVYDFKDENKIKIIDRFLGDSIPSNLRINSYLSDIKSSTNIDIESIILSIKILISKENSLSNEYRELLRYKYNIDKDKQKVVDIIGLLKYSMDPISSASCLNKPSIRYYVDYNNEVRNEFYQKIKNNNISIDKIKGVYIRTYIRPTSSRTA